MAQRRKKVTQKKGEVSSSFVYGLCRRCEYRAQMYETKVAPRCECGSVQSSVVSCYMYVPVAPFVLTKAYSRRSMFLPPLLCSRMKAVEIAKGRIFVKETKGGMLKYWSDKK